MLPSPLFFFLFDGTSLFLLSLSCPSFEQVREGERDRTRSDDERCPTAPRAAAREDAEEVKAEKTSS